MAHLDSILNVLKGTADGVQDSDENDYSENSPKYENRQALVSSGGHPRFLPSTGRRGRYCRNVHFSGHYRSNLGLMLKIRIITRSFWPRAKTRLDILADVSVGLTTAGGVASDTAAGLFTEVLQQDVQQFGPQHAEFEADPRTVLREELDHLDTAETANRYATRLVPMVYGDSVSFPDAVQVLTNAATALLG